MKGKRKLIDVDDRLKCNDLYRYNPCEHITVLNMPKGECERKDSGKCPVKEGICTPCKCIDILKELKASGFIQSGNLPVFLFNEFDKKYSMTDGQHRTCIAYQLDMDIMGFKRKRVQNECPTYTGIENDYMEIPFQENAKS